MAFRCLLKRLRGRREQFRSRQKPFRQYLKAHPIDFEDQEDRRSLLTKTFRWKPRGKALRSFRGRSERSVPLVPRQRAKFHKFLGIPPERAGV